MSRSINLILTLLVLGLIVSCATTYKLGKPYSVEEVSKILIGKTSQSDIVSYFGEPWKTGLLNGNIVYTYCYQEIVFHHDDSVDKNGNILIIEFDADNNVKNYYFNIPGKEPDLLTFMMHHKIKIEREQEQAATQTK
jgi:outer membrane protein assembly factor BamE (lipoprotein component of BamABCDE complex)